MQWVFEKAQDRAREYNIQGVTYRLTKGISTTVEPLNNGHIRTRLLSFIERLSFLRRLKCTSIIEKGPQSVSFIERLSSLWGLKCTSIIEKGPQSMSFIEKLSSIRGLKCTSIIVGLQIVSFIDRKGYLLFGG